MKKKGLQPNEQVQETIELVESGIFDNFLSEIASSNLGIFYSGMVDQSGLVVPMPKGFSQSESNLKITVQDTSANYGEDLGLKVGWIQSKEGLNCLHCNNHTSGPTCTHCSHTFCCKGKKYEDEIELALDCAEELNYEMVVSSVEKYDHILKELGKHGLGLFMLHSHNDHSMFSKLPQNLVSVITDGQTLFGQRDEVIKERGFIPNVWRFENSKRQIAGGFL